MIVITQPNATEEQIQRIVTRVREFGLEAQIIRGASRVITGVIGPEALLREKPIAAMAGVEAIIPELKPYKLAGRDSRAASSVVLGDVRLGEHEGVALISGRCAGERGRCRFGSADGYSLGVSAVRVLKSATHLAVVVGRAHVLGLREFARQMGLAGHAAGADALLIDVHHAPEMATCVGNQAVTP